MSRSMTGYGVGYKSEDGLSVTVELRSVNNRFLDITMRLTRSLYGYDYEIRNLIKSRLQRGRVSLFVKEEIDADQASDIQLDHPRLIKFAGELEKLKTELNLSGDLKLEHLLSLENIFAPSDDSTIQERVWKLFNEALNASIDQLIETAEKEGERLCSDILERVEKISELLRAIKEHSESQIDEYYQRLKVRLEEILGDDRIDKNRLETDIALAADRLDISEEIVRLDSHIQMFSNTVANDEQIGKRLGFILQEMSREANTIASKSWSLDISRVAINIKELLEQIREQVQNLE